MTDQRPIGFWLKLVDRLIDERFALTLEEHGVTRRPCSRSAAPFCSTRVLPLHASCESRDVAIRSWC